MSEKSKIIINIEENIYYIDPETGNLKPEIASFLAMTILTPDT